MKRKKDMSDNGKQQLMSFSIENFTLKDNIYKSIKKSYINDTLIKSFFAILFVILKCFFLGPVIVIDTLVPMQSYFYLPIYLIETILYPMLFGTLLGNGINVITKNEDFIVKQIMNEVNIENNLNISEILEQIKDNVESKKKIIFPANIENLDENELFKEITKINCKKIINNEADSISEFNENCNYYASISFADFINLLFFLQYFILFPNAYAFFEPSLSVLKNILVFMGVFGLSCLVANISNLLEIGRFDKDLENAINKIERTVGVDSKYSERDLNILIRAYLMKLSQKDYIKEEVSNIVKDERVEINRKPTFQKIAPKIVDYEFKGNPEERRNAKVLRKIYK